jgi:CheY-like chemotaxis protein
MKKILLIEDEQFIADMYKMKFEKEGYDIAVAGDGETGLELVKSFQPDLVLLDLVLPKMNGFQVLEKIRTDSDTKDINVYILSNLGQTGEIDQGFKEGANGYLIKSNMTPSQLIQNIEKIFKGEAVGAYNSSMNKNSITDDKSVKKLVKKTPLAANKGEGRKILLIEDEEAIVGIYKIAFEKNGYIVDAAKNGAWGVKLSDQNRYDAIVMDMVMPAMGGYEAITRIRNNELTKDTPIIILSNSAQDKEVNEALKLGASLFLLKSQVTPMKLVGEVGKLVSAEGGSASG